jgi:flagellar biosynthetic protein FliQ
MSQELAMELIRGTLLTALWIALPLLAILFLSGIVISLLQIVTSIQDPSFGTVPRLAILFIVLFVSLPWLSMRLVDYTARLLGDLGRYAH